MKFNIVLGVLLIPIVVNGILIYLRRIKKAENGKIYLPKFFVILGTITSTIFLIPVFITAFLDVPIWVPIVFLILSLFGVSLIISYVNCKISYDENGFVYKNFFGLKREYTYNQVIAIKEGVRENCIYVREHTIKVSELSVGGFDFINLVKDKYKSLHNGQNLPNTYKSKYDIFNGNIKDASSFLAVYTLIGVFVIGFLIFVINYVCFTSSNINNTIEQSVRFVSCIVNKDEIVITSTDNQIYKIRFIDEQFNSKDIQAICDGEKIVTTYSKEITPKNEDAYYSIQAIEYNGNYLLSFEETNRLHRQEYWLLIVIAIVLCFICGAYFVASIMVGRNPQKFSKKLIKLFFKDEYIRN